MNTEIQFKPHSFYSTFKIIICALVMLFFSFEIAKAQETNGSLLGKVVDEKSGFLYGATITAIHLPTGTKYVTTTNELGKYILVNMRVGGPYKLSVSYTGFKTKLVEDINIPLGNYLVYDFTLESISSNLSEVAIKGQKSAKANFTGSGKNISTSQMRNIAAGARSFQDYTKLTPQYNGNSFVGTNFRYNNVTIDGAINNDAIGFSPSLGGQTGTSGQIGSSTRTNSISIDAIQEIQVYISPFDVKIGNFTGGSINAVTRSGTNAVEGSVYSFGKSSVLTGKDYAGGTGAEPSAFHDLQTGFRIGFPIIKSKLFFFTNEEFTDRVDPLTETASSNFVQGILTQDQAIQIINYYKSNNIAFDPGTAGAYNVYSRSYKSFNRLDWNISDKHQLVIRSNIVSSDATNLTRDNQNFRFSSIDYTQHNNQVATVLELKSRFNSKMANNLILGYTAVHDYRDPKSNPYYPQIQIAGKNLGTTILLGTDREASIFNMKQRSLEITDNFNIYRGNNAITIGTHNELYGINYGFANSPNGRIDYASINDFLAGDPSRIRGNFNFVNQDRNYILNNPVAKFNVNLFSVYVQDEITVSRRFKFIPGLRFDLAEIPSKPALSIKTSNTIQDVFYGNTFSYTKPANITNNYLGQIIPSPRIGFNFDINNDKSLIFRGGSGLFTGRVPFAWFGYAFINNGNSFGSIDRRYNYLGNPNVVPAIPPTIPNVGTDPRQVSQNGIAGIAVNEGGPSALDINGKTQIDLIDNHFKLPQVWRTSAALELNTISNLKLSLEGVFTKTIYDVLFKQINLQDSASYYEYDIKKQQPIYTGKSVDPALTARYLLTNTNQGYRYSITPQITKTFPFTGLEINVAYTYGVSKDVSNGIRNSMESNWQLNQALNPNNPGLANSNFDIRNRIVSSINYRFNYGPQKRIQTNINLFFSATSGVPFTYGLVNSPSNFQNTGQQVTLAYIPKATEMINFFKSGNITLNNNTIVFKTDADQAEEFFRYIRSNPYLNGRIGQFTERNGANTPWNNVGDLRILETYILSTKYSRSITLSVDIFNLTNLIDKNWGKVYFSSDLFNSSADVGLRQVGTRAGYPIFVWEQPATPYQVDLNQSRWQIQLGARYNF